MTIFLSISWQFRAMFISVGPKTFSPIKPIMGNIMKFIHFFTLLVFRIARLKELTIVENTGFYKKILFFEK
jgi:hypothetical protein